MRHALLTLFLLGIAVPAGASLVEAPPDDYLMITPAVLGTVDPATADIVQSAAAGNGTVCKTRRTASKSMHTGRTRVG